MKVLPGGPRAVWLQLAAAQLLLSAVLGGLVLPTLVPGLDKAVYAGVVMVISLMGPFTPLETLIGTNVGLLGLVAGCKTLHGSLLGWLGAGLAVFAIVGAHLALNLVLFSRWAPAGVHRAAAACTLAMPEVIDRGFDLLMPRTLQLILGVPFTTLSELFIMPAAVCLLFSVAQLKYAGEDFDASRDGPASVSPERRKGDLVIMVHGNRFNECQWLFGRMLLTSALQDVHFMAVNYFDGPLKRDHTEATRTIEGCSAIVMEQVQAQMKSRGLEPQRVILMGHSLGGIVSAYIAETLAEKHSLPVKDVVSWSAPLWGSDLLAWAMQQPALERWGLVRYDGGIRMEFHPANEKLVALRAKIRTSVGSGRVRYFAVTGGCDPLVRPASAMLPGHIAKEHAFEIPYLGHYNIKLSALAWRRVVAHLAASQPAGQ